MGKVDLSVKHIVEFKDVKKALKSLTKEENEWIQANQDDNRVKTLQIYLSLARTYGPVDEVEFRAFITAVEDFKKWFKKAKAPTTQHEKEKAQQD